MTSPSSAPMSFRGTPDHADCAQAITQWTATAVRHAEVVVFVTGTADIAVALQYAHDHGLPVAVRSGGHNVSAAFSIERGLVIDLAPPLNGVTADAEKKLAYIMEARSGRLSIKLLLCVDWRLQAAL